MLHNPILIFDLDGTLSKPTEPIEKYLEEYITNLCRRHKIYIVSGSSRKQMMAQISPDFLPHLNAIFPFNGTNGRNYSLFHKAQQNKHPLIPLLKEILKYSKYPSKTGNHIEPRGDHSICMVNFSTLGRNASKAEREAYFLWDQIHKERESIVAQIKDALPHLQATIGGQTSIDISQAGTGKHLILKQIPKKQPVYFFGDKCYEGGNDFTISETLKLSERNKVIPVKSPEETYGILRDLFG